MKKLTVRCRAWGEDWPLGTLADDGRQLLFEYSAEALKRGIEFSPLHLPLKEGSFGNFPHFLWNLPGLFSDCLPDGWGMLLMDRLFRKNGLTSSQLSSLDRLAFIGDRAIGAFSFEPAEVWPEPFSHFHLAELAKASRVVMRGRDSAVLKDLAKLGGSPHGARPKVLVQFEPTTQSIHLNTNGPGEPWLVKFQAQGEHKEVCAIEHLYAQLARACGIEVPETRVFDLDQTHAAFGIRRFDRHPNVRGEMRVPLHTLAGVLHQDFRIPSASYADLLRVTRFMTRDQREVFKAFERCVFNVLFHNRDDHTKNFSFRMEPNGHWRLSPGYDLTFSQGPGGEHQMDIAGEGRTPDRSHLLKLAAREGLDRAFAIQCIERMTDVALRFDQIAADYTIRRTTRKTIGRVIQAQCR